MTIPMSLHYLYHEWQPQGREKHQKELIPDSILVEVDVDVDQGEKKLTAS